jgi:hypothetical protein
MRTVYYIVLSLFLFTTSSVAQERFTVSGSISDAENGETLIGATVFAPEAGEGTTTNEYGFYSLTLPAGDSITLDFSYVGFQTVQKRVLLTEDLTLNIELGSGVQLEEVVVKANSFEEQLSSTDMSVETITTKEAKLIPVLLGESDILKTVQLKPGIPSGSEGTTGLFVRGGGSDQNLILLDEALVYNASHLFGFFSTFNTDAVKDLKIYKGGFPGQYGGRLSSVIDVKLKEGNNKEFSGSGGVGLIASRLTLEGPIQKGKSSFMVSGRRTYFDIFTRLINDANEGNEASFPIPDYFFYDLNAKLNFTLSEKDRLFFSGYFGRDVFGFDSDFFNFDFNWGNITGTARWNHVFNPKLFSNTTFTYSDYQYNIANEITGFSFNVGSNIQDYALKQDYYYAPNSRHTLRFGASGIYHQFTVGRLQAGSDDGDIAFESGQDFDGVEFAAYVADEWAVTGSWKINAGLRFSGFTNDGTTYTRWEPRLASNYRVSDRMSIKASYARMHQYLHLVATTGASLPTDVWFPSTENVKPQRSDQVAAGFELLLGGDFFLTNEYYYKWLDNQLQFVDGAELFVNDNLEEEFAIGKGFAYGGELGIEKKEGKLTGWIGYTLALIRLGEFQTLDPNAVFGEGLNYFSPRYDRRHDLSIVAIYEINKRLTATATWVYGSGDLFWLPPGRFTFQDVQGSQFEAVVPVFQERNNYRLIPYHRLDLGLVIKFFPKWGESDLTLNVINAYDRRNAFFVFLEPEFQQVTDPTGSAFEIPTGITARQVSLFPILPSITYNFKF